MPGISITRDDVSPRLAEIERFLADRPGRLVMAEAAAELTRGHFAQLAAVRHRPQVTPNFYANAARATTAEVDATDALVVIDHIGIAQRYYGGLLRPKKAKRLTIPISDEAQGRRASEISDLFYLRLRNGKEFLARRDSGGGLDFLYVLKAQVQQDPDPSVLPTDEEYFDAIAQSLDDTLGGLTDGP